MATNQELVNKLALDLGVEIPKNRRPSAKLIWKWQDMDLLPHSSSGTLLGEIYDWSGRNWRTTENNLIGEIFTSEERIIKLKAELKAVPKEKANIPDFEFTKEDLVKLDFSIPSLFDLKIKGDIDNAKDLSVKVNGVIKSRLTNIDQPGISIMHRLSEFAQENSKEYRKKLKNDYVINALFYADSVEINLKKKASTNIELGFAKKNIDVTIQVDTDTEKKIKLKYTGDIAPFAANFVKVKNLDD